MPSRTCPNCKSLLGLNDYYFCSNCGTVLSADLVQKPSVVKTSLYVVSQSPFAKFSHELLLKFQKETSKHLTKKNVFLGFVAVLIISNLILFLLLTNKSFFFPGKENKVAVNVPNVLDLGLGTSSGVFGAQSISQFVPKNAGFYLEGFDYKGLLNKYLPNAVPYRENILRSQNLLDGHFVIFSTKVNGYWEWTGIFTPTDPRAVQAELEAVNLGSLKYKFMEDKLVITSKEEILKDVEDSGNNTALNVTLSPPFAVTKAKLPKDGQLLIMFLTADSKEIFTQLRGFSLNPAMTFLMEQLLKSGYNDFVIKDLSVK